MPIILVVLLLLLAASGSAHAQTAPKVETYKTVGPVQLQAHLFAPAPVQERRPAVVLFHGGGWNAGSPEWVYASARRFAGLGLVSVAVQYRLSDHKTVTPLDAVEDARDAMRWVRTHAERLGIDPNRVVAYGVSAGGHLASMAALGEMKGGASPVPDALLLHSPAVSTANSGWFRRLLLGRAKPEDAAPDQLVRKGFPPTHINQGEEDTVTPFAGARGFCARVAEVGSRCELRRFASIGHLLSRKLDEQEFEFDVDPAARADAWRSEARFLASLGYIPADQVKGSDSPETVVRAQFADFNERRVGPMAARVAEDFVWYDIGASETRVEVRGREAFRKGMEDYFRTMASVRSEAHMLTTNGPFVSVRERVTWKTAAGEPRSQNALSVYEVTDGLIRRVWYYPAVK